VRRDPDARGKRFRTGLLAFRVMRTLTVEVVLASLLVAACSGSDGAAGAPGAQGDPGTPGAPGVAGPRGDSPWFTGPGLAVEVTELDVTPTGATVSFRLRDGAGAPLDRQGLLTQGRVELGFVLGQRAGDPASTYVPYTTVVQVAANGGTSATHGAAEADGLLEPVDVLAGTYRYTFAAPLAGFDPAATQTAIVTAERTFDGVVHRATASRSVRPAGGAPAERVVVEDARCGACHGAASAHEGRYTALSQCVVCHVPGATDPDTGSSLDLRVMVHRIHRGAELPSVIAGGEVRIVGAGGVAHDWSTVAFPQPVGRCAACHGGADGDAWKTRPGEAACLSCHDDVSFVDPAPPGLRLHGGGVLAAGATCTTCHQPDAGLSPISVSHLAPAYDPASPRVEVALVDASAAPPGAAPSFTFAVQVDGQPRNILDAPLTSIRVTVAGPNDDYARYWQATVHGSGASGTLEAVDAAAGVFRYTLPASGAVPVDATGSYTLALEAYLQVGSARHVAFSPVRAFAVTDAAPSPRREVVEAARCDACHLDLAAHGGTRKNPSYCATCHNPNNPNDERVARFEGSTSLAESTELGVMIHRIHMGSRLTQPYVLGGSPVPTVANPGGTPRDFGAVRYPRSPASCEACHLPGTYELPLQGRLPRILTELTCGEDPIFDTDSYCTNPFWTITETIPVAPETAACTGCHDAPYVAVHAELATSASGGEACATCHGPGATWDVRAVHPR
jgi:OmcA/MtrC family decaheme c-type cytochrome